MKTLLTITFSVAIALSISACSNNSTPGQTLKNIENGTGRALGNANSVIRTGAENGDKVWTTEEKNQ